MTDLPDGLERRDSIRLIAAASMLGGSVDAAPRAAQAARAGDRRAWPADDGRLLDESGVQAFLGLARRGSVSDHQPSSWDLVYRAELSYAEMAPYSDFIKFIAYQDVLGPRIRWWYLDRLQKTVLSELTLEESLDLYYDLFGYDKRVEPTVDRLEADGFTPDYVARETRRSVASAEGRTRIYTGIGFDVPWGNRSLPADPREVHDAAVKAFEAGADGIVVSREYEEMRLPNLEAVGSAVRAVRR